MPTEQQKKPKTTAAERQRVLDAFDRGDNWLSIALANGISRSSAYVLVKTRQIEDKKRGGLRAKCVKMTPEIMISLEDAVEHNPTITLATMRLLIFSEHGVDLSLSTISRHLTALTYTMKKLRLERNSMNSIANKIERREFALKLEAYRAEVGRAKAGERATTSVPISQGKNLQIQCAVSNGVGVMEVNFVVGKIDMDMNASFLLDTFISAMRWADNQATYRGKKIVLVLDNAPAHDRSEEILVDRLLESKPTLPTERLVLLRLAPYSPMCNPIEGCFSVMKSAIKSYVALNRGRLRFHDGQCIEAQKLSLLREAADYAMERITPAIVLSHEIHSAKWWEKAKHMEDMRLGE